VSTLAPGTPIEVWFQDEMRVGQKNSLVYQWARKGSRPRQPKDQRYENAYGRVNLFYRPYARARALMARPWSARCYGVARQREGSRQNSIGVAALTSFIGLTRARGR
jgi:hypothetical protein